MKHPNIKDDNFYKKINDIYKHFEIPKKKQSFKEFCYPKKYELQLPQKFPAEFLNPKTPYKGILIYHRIGAGKTCTSIRIAEEWKHKKKIVVVLPASLKNNFKSELRSSCAGDNYLKESERNKLKKLHPSSKEYKEIIKSSNDRINEYYEIHSYNKFIELIQLNKINLKNTLLIIDEIQNMVSEDGTFYIELYNLIKKASDDLRLVLLSATPMFDKPQEIGLTMNLLRPNIPFPVGKAFDRAFIETKTHGSDKIPYKAKNLDIFKSMIKGYISYFRGAPSYVFPTVVIKYIKCEMSDFQYSVYKGVLKHEKQIHELGRTKSVSMSEMPNNFFLGTRYTSNIVFPNKLSNDDGFKSLTKTMLTKNLAKISIKFDIILKKISKTSGKIFIYSSFKEYAGLKSLVKILEAFGYKNYSGNGEGKKRFAVWSGDESITYKDEIKNIYNMTENINGSKIKIILGSSSIKEGVSFSNVRQVHILEPYWNQSRIEQVIGRASRFCSHKELSEEKRTVKVYIYIATHKNEKETIDEYIHKLSLRKNKIIGEFEQAIKESAIDCKLNKEANITDKNEKFKCDI